MRRILRLVCGLAAVVPAASSVLPAHETAPTAPEHRQFVFWVGELEVTTPNGAFDGRYRRR